MNNDMTVFGAAVGIISNAVSTARNAVELAKISGNQDLKVAVSDVLNDVLDLKLKIAELGDENREYRELCRTLELRLKDQTSIKRDSQFGYWFKNGESDPLCPKCYEGIASEIRYLSGLTSVGFDTGRVCRKCKWANVELKRPYDELCLAQPSLYKASRGYGD